MSPHFRLKKLTAYPEWHKKPFLLNCSEMTNPYIVLTEFFDRYDLNNIRVVLKQWLDDSLNGEEAEAASHHYTYENVGRLIEAAWVIMEQKRQAKADEGFDGIIEKQESGEKEEEDQNDDDKGERERFVKWVTFPVTLKATPLLYMKRVFEVMDLNGLELVIARWQKIALTAEYGRYDNSGERADLLDFCESFVRLLEGSYVLQRIAEWDTEGRTRWVLSEEIKYDLLAEEQTYRISEEEIGNPLDIIKSFFQTFSTPYARRELWDMLACAVEYKGEDLKRLDMLLDYECLDAILEAAWLLYNEPAMKSEALEENKPENL